MNSIACHNALALTGESPLWDLERECLWWIDIQGQRLLRHTPRTQVNQQYPLPSMPGLLAICSDGIVVGLEDGLWVFNANNKSINKISSLPNNLPNTRINDGKVDSYGRLWFGIMGKNAENGIGSLMCRNQDGEIVNVLSNITIPNSISFSIDSKTIYFSDSASKQLCSYEISEDKAQLNNKKIIKTYNQNEYPDGSCIDSEGGIWVAVVGGARIERLDSSGMVTKIINLPVSRPTMPVFGGSNMDCLFITSQRRFLNSKELLSQPLAGNLIMMVMHTFKGIPKSNYMAI